MKYDVRIAVKSVGGTFETATSRIFEVDPDHTIAAKASCPDSILDMTVREIICGKQPKQQTGCKKVFKKDVKIYVMVGDTDDSAKYAAIDEDGQEVINYPLPNTKISVIDRIGKFATDEMMYSYPLLEMSE